MLIQALTAITAIVLGGYMVLDGVRELAGHGYIAPGGQLGPWAGVLRRAGLDPRSRFVASWFVAHGSLILLTLICHLVGIPGSAVLMVVLAVAALWYLPFGTLGALVIIGCVALG